jgi:hypothetical protein
MGAMRSCFQRYIINYSCLGIEVQSLRWPQLGFGLRHVGGPPRPMHACWQFELEFSGLLWVFKIGSVDDNSHPLVTTQNENRCTCFLLCGAPWECASTGLCTVRVWNTGRGCVNLSLSAWLKPIVYRLGTTGGAGGTVFNVTTRAALITAVKVW